MPNKHIVNPLTLAEYRALAEGIAKYSPTGTFTLNSRMLTSPEAVAFVNSMLAIASAVATAKTEWTTARAKEAEALAANGEALKDLRNLVRIMFNGNATVLAAFSIAPPKERVPLTGAELALKAAKAKATRLARGTKGKKQAAAITGDVTGVTITPVMAPGTAAVTPATSASSGTGTGASPTAAATGAMGGAHTTG